MPKYGDFISAKVKPQWKSKTKPAADGEGYVRGAKGIDGLADADGLDWVGTHNAESDKRNATCGDTRDNSNGCLGESPGDGEIL